MIADLKPYAKYKESGLPWLGQVPVTWEVKRAKSIFERIDIRSTTGKEELLTVSSSRGIVPRNTANVTMFKAESYLGYKLCWPGDLVINSLWAWAGGLGVSSHHGIISSAYGVYRIRENAPIAPEFVHQVVRSSSFSWELRVRSKGVWTSRLQLTDISFLDAPIQIPPPAEQAAIVRFLDWANGRLERAIRAKRKVIALLNEQKQAIIHRAVTHGLDPSVPLKPSGIPWLGDIPQHWEVTRSKYIYREVDNRSVTGEEPHLSMSQKFGLIPSGQIESKRLTSESYVGAKVCEQGDLVLNRLKAHLGVFALANQRGLVSPDYTVLRPIRVLVDRFFEAVYRTPACRVELRQRAKGIVQGFWRLYTDDFYDIKLPVPPIEEQQSIIARLDFDLSGIITAISRLEREIELLREYRTRLVADVVTGKLDVREAAAGLPDEGEPATADDEPDPDIDPEETAAEAAA
jgi:type I restriction enzyme S subunit